MKITGIIPARLGSYRFPTKSLEDIHGMPMVIHVMKRSEMCDVLDEVYVATPNEEIFECVERFGGKAVMTHDRHRRGTERVHEASTKVGGDIVINIQGDEPMITPEAIELAVNTLLSDSSLSCVNLFKYIGWEEATDNNEVKMVADSEDIAMYFSREPIPAIWLRDKEIRYKSGVWVMPFTAESLADFVSLPNGYLEEIENVDMLRFAENGRRVKVVESPVHAISVDVPADLDRVRELMANDKLMAKYL